ncbi:MAG: ribosome assembly cofactor RimP [Mariprofundaceae bacterium]|nr:ribosome assembly cofactor RimP [Mariprofundaceae bacterium]
MLKVGCGSLFLFLESQLIENRIRDMLTPIAREMGVDVLKVSLGGGGHQQLLRVIIDQAGGVPFDSVERISRALSLQLDAEDLIRGRYRLEVSSPGLDWPLREATDFRRHAGEMLQVCFEGRSDLMGENLGPCSDGVRIRDAQGNEHEIAVREVVKIVRVVEWERARKKKKKQS